jgi:hypothetical protein
MIKSEKRRIILRQLADHDPQQGAIAKKKPCSRL